MITISENAALRRRISISIEMIPCHDCDQQKCQDIISVKILFVVRSINTISVNVTVLQLEIYNASQNRFNFSHTSYHGRNIILRVNKKLYPKLCEMYKSNRCREVIFTSNQHLGLYPNELKFELLHVS